jgi:hypothetical protein
MSHYQDSVIASLPMQKEKYVYSEVRLEQLDSSQSLTTRTPLIWPQDSGKKFKVFLILTLASGTSPSARAAHGAVSIEPYKIVIFGGATGSGGLASDDLYHLDMKEGVGIWNVINVSHKTPGKRYGHTFSYSKPYLIVFGGNIGEKSVNDCWILNIQKPPLVWT